MRLANITAVPFVIISIPVALFMSTFGADNPNAGVLPFLSMGLPFLLAIPPSMASYAHKGGRYKQAKIYSTVSLTLSGLVLFGIIFFAF